MRTRSCTPDYDSTKVVHLSRPEKTELRQALRSIGKWHFDLFKGRNPRLQVAVHPTQTKDVYVAEAGISLNWRDGREVHVVNHVTVTRRRGALDVRARHPFIPT